MSLDSSDLAARVASRLCHDLISPIGAISNGLELLSLSGNGGAETDLIRKSAELAAARLRLFRLAFGAATETQQVAASELRAIVAGLSANMRYTCQWDCSAGCPRAEAKRIFLALLCLETAMSHGGAVTVTRQDGSTTIRAEASRFRALPGHWDHLAHGRIEPFADGPASEVQFPLLAASLAEGHRSLTVAMSDNHIQLDF